MEFQEIPLQTLGKMRAQICQYFQRNVCHGQAYTIKKMRSLVKVSQALSLGKHLSVLTETLVIFVINFTEPDIITWLNWSQVKRSILIGPLSGPNFAKRIDSAE